MKAMQCLSYNRPWSAPRVSGGIKRKIENGTYSANRWRELPNFSYNLGDKNAINPLIRDIGFIGKYTKI